MIKAPTWLFRDGKTELFRTQSEVDIAVEAGWKNDPEPKKEEKPKPKKKQAIKSRFSEVE